MEDLQPVCTTSSSFIPVWTQYLDSQFHEIGIYSAVEAILFDGILTYEKAGGTKNRYNVVAQWEIFIYVKGRHMNL